MLFDLNQPRASHSAFFKSNNIIILGVYLVHKSPTQPAMFVSNLIKCTWWVKSWGAAGFMDESGRLKIMSSWCKCDLSLILSKCAKRLKASSFWPETSLGVLQKPKISSDMGTTEMVFGKCDSDSFQFLQSRICRIKRRFLVIRSPYLLFRVPSSHAPWLEMLLLSRASLKWAGNRRLLRVISIGEPLTQTRGNTNHCSLCPWQENLKKNSSVVLRDREQVPKLAQVSQTPERHHRQSMPTTFLHVPACSWAKSYHVSLFRIVLFSEAKSDRCQFVSSRCSGRTGKKVRFGMFSALGWRRFLCKTKRTQSGKLVSCKLCFAQVGHP